jgi:hypothetical protein
MVDDQVKHDIQDDPYGEQSADGLRSASQQFTSPSSIEEQTEQVGRVWHRLQDEAETSWP